VNCENFCFQKKKFVKLFDGVKKRLHQERDAVTDVRFFVSKGIAPKSLEVQTIKCKGLNSISRINTIDCFVIKLCMCL